VLAAADAGRAEVPVVHALERFADALGIAYQIRDDLLDLTEPVVPGTRTSDEGKAKATYPRLFGVDAARHRAEVLLRRALAAIEGLGGAADGLRWMAEHTVLRDD